MKTEKNKIIWGSIITVVGIFMILKYNFNIDFSYIVNWPWMQIIPIVILLIGSWIVVDGINDNRSKKEGIEK